MNEVFKSLRINSYPFAIFDVLDEDGPSPLFENGKSANDFI